MRHYCRQLFVFDHVTAKSFVIGHFKSATQQPSISNLFSSAGGKSQLGRKGSRSQTYLSSQPLERVMSTNNRLAKQWPPCENRKTRAKLETKIFVINCGRKPKGTFQCSFWSLLLKVRLKSLRISAH